MDKTLEDYIKRMKELEAKRLKKEDNTEKNQYPVYPEDQGEDRPQNPYSQA